MVSNNNDNLILEHFTKQPPLQPLIILDFTLHFVILSVTMVMGIPTVKRKVKSYLSETLRSLIDKLSPEEKLDCVIIVFVGEVSGHIIRVITQ